MTGKRQTTDRSRLRRATGIGTVVVAGSALLAGYVAPSSATTLAAADASSSLLPGPPKPTPQLTKQQVAKAVAQLDGIVATARQRTGVPGVAVAVVYRDEVVYSKGFGVREVGKPGKVDPKTVFQLASVSKPLASTIVAGVLGRKKISWDDPVIRYNPRFALKDPYVTRNATFADLMSHRSGLYTGAGDFLEDLGWGRTHILSRLRQQPLDAFRSTYHYSNFGYTEGGQAAADAAGTSWSRLAQQVLFGPLGMTRSSYVHADFMKHTDKALIHVLVGPAKNKVWRAKYVRDADAEAPAGGASSSVADLSQFLRLQLAGGRFDGKRIIDAGTLQTTHVPHQDLPPPPPPEYSPYGRTQFYGLGWNVTNDDQGRVRLNHSGAFALGAATNVAMIPVEQLGIVTLTNGEPRGIPEAINNDFFDAAQYGAQRIDWLGYYGRIFDQLENQKPTVDWSKPPAHPRPARPHISYVGTYQNPYYGPLTVESRWGWLSMRMGPPAHQTRFRLRHYSGNTFYFATIGENATGLSGAHFTANAAGRIARVRLDAYDTTGLGTFVRR